MCVIVVGSVIVAIVVIAGVLGIVVRVILVAINDFLF